MRRQHSMPFGAEVLAAAGVRFSLWALAAQHVDLCLEDGMDTMSLPLKPAGNGWFQLITSVARAGSRSRSFAILARTLPQRLPKDGAGSLPDFPNSATRPPRRVFLIRMLRQPFRAPF